MTFSDLRQLAYDSFHNEPITKARGKFNSISRQLAQTTGVNTDSYLLARFYDCRFGILMGDYVPCQNELKALFQQHEDKINNNFYLTGLYHFLLGSAQYYLGNRKGNDQETEKAVVAIKNLSIKNYLDRFELGLIYLHQGKANWKQRSFSKALQNYVEVIQLCFEEDADRMKVVFGKALNLIGVLLMDLKKTEDAEDYLKFAHSVYRKAGIVAKQHLYVGILELDAADCYLQYSSPSEEQLLLAEEKLKLARKIFDRIYGERPHRYRAGCLRVEARYLKETNRTEVARIVATLDEQIDQLRSAFSDSNAVPLNHPSVAKARNQQSRAYRRTGDLENGLRYAKLALMEAIPGYDGGVVLPAELEVNVNCDLKEIFRALYNKAKLRLMNYCSASSIDEAKDLNLTYAYLQYASNLIVKYVQEPHSIDSKLFLIEQTRPIHQLALELLYITVEELPKRRSDHCFVDQLQFDRDKVYLIVLLNKALLLLRTAEEMAGQVTSGDSTPGLGYFQRTIEALRKCLEPLTSGEKKKVNFQQNVDLLSRRMGELQMATTTESEDTEALNATITVDKIRAELSGKDAAILSYFVSEDSCYGVLLTDKDFKVAKVIASSNELKSVQRSVETVHHLVDEVFDASSKIIKPTNPRLIEFTSELHFLYQKLMEPFSAELKRGVKRMYVIPDTWLWKLSFELLLDRPVAGKQLHELDYFFHKYFLTYHFSTFTLHKYYRRKATKNQDGLLLGFALVAGQPNALEDVNLLLQPLEQIEKDHRESLCQISIRKNLSVADRTTLLADLSDYSGVLFHAHGSTPAGTSVLNLFRSPEEALRSLTVDDVMRFNKQLGWELLVSISCYSNVGDIKVGEGVMSLTRAFFVKGVKNQIYTVHKVKIAYSNRLIKKLFLKMKYQPSNTVPVARLLQNMKVDLSKNPSLVPADFVAFRFIGDQMQCFITGFQKP